MSSIDINKKREEYLAWEDYFMGTAILAGQRSKDPATQVGACIVNKDKRIVGVGYNGMPDRCSDEDFPWAKEGKEERKRKYFYVCHAEMNAIMNKYSADVKGCTIYVTLFPCNECAKLIIQSGIREVVYLSDKHAAKPATEASKLMFKAAEVSHKLHEPKQEKIVIDLKMPTSTSQKEQEVPDWLRIARGLGGYWRTI